MTPRGDPWPRSRRIRERSSPRALAAACAIGLVAGTGGASLARGQEALARAPWVLDCGGEERDEGDRPYAGEGVLRLQDRRVEGGEPVRRWWTVLPPRAGAELGTGVFTSARRGPCAWRFALPEGEWVLTLGFCETGLHLPGRRVLGVRAGGRLVVERLDPFRAGGYARPLLLRRVVRATGRPLEVELLHRAGEPPELCAIGLRPRARARGLAEAPEDLRAIRALGHVTLDWLRPGDPELRGFVIEKRREGEEAWSPLVGEPVPGTRFVDADVGPGRSADYRVRSVDLDGDIGFAATVRDVRPGAPEAAGVPVWRLEIAAAARGRVLEEVTEDREVHGDLVLDGRWWAVEVRLRGASTRHRAKKGWRIRFLDGTPLERKVTYLKAHSKDPTGQQAKLSHDVFHELGLPASRVRWVHLLLNGRHRGLALETEPIRSPIRDREPFDRGGRLLRAATFGWLDGRPPGDPRGDEPQALRELEDLVRGLNRVDRGAFEGWLRHAVDWPRVRDYLVAQVLVHRSEIEANDWFLYREPDRGPWWLLPWDHNNGNWAVDPRAARIGEPVIDVFPQTIQDLGAMARHAFVLPSRAFSCPALRRDYLDRLEESCRRILLSGRIVELIRANARVLEEEWPRDPWRPLRDATGRDPFPPAADRLVRFARAHGRRILRLVDRARERVPPAVRIAEFAFGPRRGWVELHNPSEHEVALRGWRLVSAGRVGRSAWSFPEGASVPAGGRIVREFPRRPPPPRPKTDDLEALERWELALRRGAGGFRGFAPGGGFLALEAPVGDGGEVEDEDGATRPDVEPEERPRRVADFFFYGPRDEGLSYGRTGDGFGLLEPTPGAPNRPAPQRPPPFPLDGRLRFPVAPGGPSAVVDLVAPGDEAAPAEVVCRWEADGARGSVVLRVERASPRRGARAWRGRGDLPEALEDQPFRYWFEARSPGGLVRRAPVTAPRDAYRYAPEE